MAMNGTPLGNELLSIIFAFLPARDLAKAEVACVRWHQVIVQYALWKVKTAQTGEGSSPLARALPAEASGYTSQQWKRLYWRHLAAWKVDEPRNTIIKFLEGHKQPVTCLAALSHTFASGSGDKTVRLWNRHSGACKAVLLLPSVPTAVTLMSNDLVVVIHNCTCSMFKGPKRLRHIVSSDQQHICATAILDNQLFIASVGSNCVQVWDLFCGSLQMILRPAPGSNITALASGTVHATQVVLVGMHDSQILALSPTDGSVIASMDWLRTADKAAGEIRGIVLHEDNQALVAYSLHPRKDLTRYCRLCFSLRGDNVAKFDRRFGSNFTAQHHGAPPEHPPYAVFYASGVLACYNEQPHSGASLWSASLESLPAHQQSCSACARVEHTNVYATIPWRSQYLQLCGKSKLTFGYFGSMAYDKELWWDKMFAAAPNCCGSSPQILSACGVLLTQASLSRVAVWHFPDVPD